MSQCLIFFSDCFGKLFVLLSEIEIKMKYEVKFDLLLYNSFRKRAASETDGSFLEPTYGTKKRYYFVKYCNHSHLHP